MYNPSLHTATNKPIGITNKPVDARTYYYDSAAFTYRPYASTDEVLGYLIGTNRVGHFSIIIGSDEYWFKDGITDGDLVEKGGVVSGQVMQLIEVGDPAPYELTAPQLSTINAMGRYPVFGAYIGGVNFPDITVDYDGSPGSFTAATVNLHSDGGLNLDTTFIQFT